MKNGKKKLLYRKVNTRAHGVHHNIGSEYQRLSGDLTTDRTSMRQGIRRGLDYTPLFRFLLSRVGDDWDEVHSEAIARLEKSEPIFWLVALRREDGREVVRIGESSYFSGLFVDEENRLQVVAPHIGPGHLEPQCKCCTHTFNGQPFTRPFQPQVVKQ